MMLKNKKNGLVTILLLAGLLLFGAIHFLNGLALAQETIGKEDAEAKASDFAKKQNPFFKNPYIERSVLKDKKWIIELYSFPPSDTRLGEQYMLVAVDIHTGVVSLISSGGGS
jgi:hypothetical protein